MIITDSDTAHAERLAKNPQAPFEVVISAEGMGVYKPRLGAFEYLFDRLGVRPMELEHDEHWLGCEGITDIAYLPVLFGLDN